MSLPNPDMTFLSNTPGTASDMNKMVENDQALAGGSGLDDGSITPEKTTFTDHSTNETVVGTWNGKKLYRKMFTGTLSAGAGVGVSTNMPEKIPGATAIVDSSGYFVVGDSATHVKYTIPGDGTSGRSSGASLSDTDGTVRLYTASDIVRTNQPFELAIEYIKE